MFNEATMPPAWREQWSREWLIVTSRLQKECVMWKMIEKTVAGQDVYEVMKVVQDHGKAMRCISAGLFLTQEEAENMCRVLNGRDEKTLPEMLRERSNISE